MKKPSRARYEIPAIAWNDVRSGIQVSHTMADRIVIRVDSLPNGLDKAALKAQMSGLDITWLTLRGLKEALAYMVLHSKAKPALAEEVALQAIDAITQFKTSYPGRSALKNQRQILEIATKRGFDPYEVTADLLKLSEAGHEFFNIMAAPVERLYSPVAALRRVTTERELLRGKNSLGALQRRIASIPASIKAADVTVEKIRGRMRRLARMAATAEARCQQLRVEQVDLVIKLEARGVIVPPE